MVLYIDNAYLSMVQKIHLYMYEFLKSMCVDVNDADSFVMNA